MATRKRNLDLEKMLDDDWHERTVAERRSDEDKRTQLNCEYFIKGGKERRRLKERRRSNERRDGWIRVGKWRSEAVFEE
jgi:hypothetical protein